MPSRRCPYCERLWPAKDDYKECPNCLEPTSIRTVESMPDGIAEVERVRVSFGWWLFEHDRV